jgi:hypothetical protein
MKWPKFCLVVQLWVNREVQAGVAPARGTSPSRRVQWLAISLVYFAISMITVPEAGEATRNASVASLELANRMASSDWRDLAALLLSMIGMVLLIHGIFRTHPGRDARARYAAPVANR